MKFSLWITDQAHEQLVIGSNPTQNNIFIDCNYKCVTELFIIVIVIDIILFWKNLLLKQR
jgi:hypothetical protein